MQYEEQKKIEGNTYLLYTYFRSSTSWRVRTVLNYKKISYDCKFIHLVKEEQTSE
jgi:glutathione S-transferase